MPPRSMRNHVRALRRLSPSPCDQPAHLREAPQLRDAAQWAVMSLGRGPEASPGALPSNVGRYALRAFRVERNGFPTLARCRQTRTIPRSKRVARQNGRVSNRADRPITHVPREERK